MVEGVDKTWIDDEPGAARSLVELERLRQRARRRPLLTIGLTLLLTAGLVGWRARGVRFYTARAILRVSEGDLDPMTAPRPKSTLRGYVTDAAFTNQRLLDIIKQRKLYPVLAHDDPNAAVAAMRKDIKVDVYRNYFLIERRPDDPPRSARIAISYRGRDPLVAQAVLTDLADTVARNEQMARQASAEKLLAVLTQAVDDAQEALVTARRHIVEGDLARAQLKGADAMAMQVRVADLKRSIPGLEFDLQKSLDAKQKFALRTRFEQEQRGLRFDVVDEGFEETQTVFARPAVQLTVTGIVGLLLALPLCAILVGAIDSRIYDGDDVRRLGLRSLGIVPAYDGDDVGAFSKRRDMRPGVK